MPEARKQNSFPVMAKWLLLAGILSFLGGLGLFLTLATSRSGDPIPVDAAPNYYIHDAG